MGAGQSEVAAAPDPPEALTKVSFVLNGKDVIVENASSLLSLNDWLRGQPGLAGTKRMCGEGGCGCCVVSASTSSLVQVVEDSWDCQLLPQDETTIAINSCLCPLYAVNGWHITTVEGIGSSNSGFHPIQLRLADFNGTQCGYCTPGFVMSMYSLLQSNPHPTKQQVEDNFDGNICRCTGYRSILDAMKSFAVDSSEPVADIEDLGTKKVCSKVCPKSGKECRGGSTVLCSNGLLRTDSDPAWYSPTSIAQLASLFAANSDSTFKLLGGDTGRGVYKESAPVKMLVSLSDVTELKTVQVSGSSLTVGAAVSLSSLIRTLQDNSDKSSNFSSVASHLLKIANTPVRNVGTWAGNLMLAHAHDDFPSDVFLLLAASQAQLTIGSIKDSTSTATHTLWEFLSQDMSSSIILSVKFPFMSDAVKFKSYKIMPRAENAAAHAHAAFSLPMKSSDSYTVSGTPTLVVGGGSTRPMLCSEASKFLADKTLTDDSTLKGCMDALSKDLASTTDDYKKSAIMGLLYKFYLSCIGDHCSSGVKSASSLLVRPISTGSQVFTPDKSEAPVGQPINKLAAKLQASGEAQFTTDLPLLPNELAAAFVLTTKANVEIVSMDTSVAETMPGYVAVLTARDIPPGGLNNVSVSPLSGFVPEELLADYRSEYVGQAAALVLADCQRNAEKIAKAVTFKYGEPSGPLIVDVKKAVDTNSMFPDPTASFTTGDVKTALAKSDMHLVGQIDCGSQYHFTMETQTALVVPSEGDTYDVFSASQWPGFVQAAVANVLGIPSSGVDVTVRRLGGAYGCKITRPNRITAACALGAQATRRPVRMHMDLETNMKLIGKRYPFLATYQIAFSKEGIVNGLIVNVFGDAGRSPNDNALYIIQNHIDNVYHIENWEFHGYYCKTNLPANTPCRSPGSVPGTFIIESIFDHVAKTLGKEVEEIKRMNFYKQGQATPVGKTLKYCQIDSLWDQLYKSADFEARRSAIADFNKANRWMKRGIAMVPLKFELEYAGAQYAVLVSVYSGDGTVAITHGGVECGQGIDTKVCQVAALTLGVPMERIKIKPNSTVASPNGGPTGGSITSELACLGTQKACKMLLAQMQPVKDKNPDLPWNDLVALCFSQSVDLSAKYYVTASDGAADYYFSYGATVTEVELDVLTGQVLIPRVDILYDCGDSLNPKIDIGQVEGAFVMGLGYWLTEKLIYDEETGENKTINTWTYKPPSSKDIPIDFRVELLKDAPNPVGVLGSKAVGEPPLCMSCSALFAIKRAIEEARKDAGNTDFFPLSGPATLDVIHNTCLVDPKSFTL